MGRVQGLVLALLIVAHTDLAHCSWRDKNYLLPILRAGPNNQLRHLRFALAFARQLNRTLILTGIKKHYTDRGLGFERNGYAPAQPGNRSELRSLTRRCFQESTPHFIEFEEVFDRQFVQEYNDVITHQELKLLGWNGIIDALVLPNGTNTERWLPYFSMTALPVGCEMYHTVSIIYAKDFLGCNAQQLRSLRERTKNYKVLMMMAMSIGNTEAVELSHDVVQPKPKPGCWLDLWQANRRIRSNIWLQSIAKRYIDLHIHTHDFLALHLRPQTDVCFKFWVTRKFVTKDLWTQANCWRGHEMLHEQFANRTLAAMHKHNMTTLFVMAHPYIRSFITEKLQEVGLSPIYMESDQVAEIAGCYDSSSTFLALVEMQVGVQATVLLGTASSSITETVVYERLAQGRTLNEFVDRPFLPYPSPPAPLPPPAPVSEAVSLHAHLQHRVGEPAAAGDEQHHGMSQVDAQKVGDLALAKLQQHMEERQRQQGKELDLV